MKSSLHWELGIDHGDDIGTETIESFDSLSDAIKELRLCDNDTAFIDLWCGSENLGETLRKADL